MIGQSLKYYKDTSDAYMNERGVDLIPTFVTFVANGKHCSGIEN